MGSQRRTPIHSPKLSLALAACLIGGMGAPFGSGAAGYMDAEALGKQLKKIASSNAKVVRVKSAAQSLSKRDVWLVELGKGSDEERAVQPAMLVVAGIEGNDLAGGAAAVTWIEQLASRYATDDKTRRLLDATTLYVFPRVNPDAAESFFAKPQVETSVSSKPVDDDHDGMTDEDGPDDLDGDGRITWMRVQDPEGDYILDPAEPRLLRRADRTKGEAGAWRFLTEGRDNDNDEKWNEDGPGGVNFNRNFPFQYEWFEPSTGVHQVSEVETRALADFVVGHRNIGIAFTFGVADNLVAAPRAEATTATAITGSRRPLTAINDNDLPYYRRMGEVYRKTVGLTSELSANSPPGTFSDWVYFHRGRLSVAAQAWSPALQLELAKPPSKEPKESKDEPAPAAAPAAAAPADPPAKFSGRKGGGKAAPAKKSDSGGRPEQERAFLKWLDENAPDRFVRWHPFDHPDFPKQKVEVGGFAPFAKTAPPEAILKDLTAKQADFLTTLALQLPRVGIRKMTAKHLGESVYEVAIEVENTGYLPTALAHGEITREVFQTRVTLDLDPKAFLSGSKMTQLRTIAGSGGMQEVRYVVLVPKRKPIKVSVVSMLGGTVEASLELDGEKKP